MYAAIQKYVIKRQKISHADKNTVIETLWRHQLIFFPD